MSISSSKSTYSFVVAVELDAKDILSTTNVINKDLDINNSSSNKFFDGVLSFGIKYVCRREI